MNDRTSLTIVLAAGEGTRMRSSLPKVLHQVAGSGFVPGEDVAVVLGVRDARPRDRTYLRAPGDLREPPQQQAHAQDAEQAGAARGRVTHR